MNQIQINITKADVWEEVMKTSEYTGTKLPDEDGAVYERLHMTDEDAKSLQRFWANAVAIANENLKDMLESVSAPEDDYNATLNVSAMYPQTLNDGVTVALRGYFIYSITSAWYKYANKEETQDYAELSTAMMQEALKKLYSRRGPQRPVKKNRS